MNPEEQIRIGESAPAAPALGPSAGARMELRRRLLLRGLVGAPVTLAAMRPVKTLAKAKKYCNYSGWYSVKVDASTSAKPQQNTCNAGKSNSYYLKKKGKNSYQYRPNNWPNVPSNRTMWNPPWGQNTTFGQVFGGGSSDTLISALATAPGANNRLSIEGAFVAALFNAYSFYPSYPFKYTDIYAIWNANGGPCSVPGFSGVSQYYASLFFEQLDSSSY